MSQDIVPRSAHRLIVAARIEHQFPKQLTVLAHDPHVEPRHEHEHPRSRVAAPNFDVVKPAVVAKCDPAASMSRSRRTRQCTGILAPRGPAFGRASYASAGVRRPIARCGLTSL